MIKIGDTLDNRYYILEHLGSGGMADVFEAKDLIAKGLAYPCFCSSEELDKIRENQEKAKETAEAAAEAIGANPLLANCRQLTFAQFHSGA